MATDVNAAGNPIEGWGDPSANGVPILPADYPLPVRERLTSARRSPFVRAAQRSGSRRPDLITVANSLQP